VRADHFWVLHTLTSDCREVEGLVGPLVDSGVLLVEALPECVADACDVDAREDMIQFVRQVGSVFRVHGTRRVLDAGALLQRCATVVVVVADA
jgi:hypothetical protein